MRRDEELEVVLVHYAALLGRVGLTYHREIVKEAWEQVRDGKIPPPRKDRGPLKDGAFTKLVLRGVTYLGRFFSRLLEEYNEGKIDKEAAFRRHAKNDVEVFYSGVDVNVLSALRGHDWDYLLGYRGLMGEPKRDGSSEHHGGDGSVIATGIDNPSDWTPVLQTIGKELKSG
ncbi:MAG: hypothetical protein GY835_09480 [bacterium]|nr:hypothetical protein [bacterium]